MDSARVQQLLEANAADAETQLARFEAAKGKKMVVVSAPFAFSKFSYEMAKAMGVEMYILGTPGSKFCQSLVEEGLAVRFIEADMDDDKHALENCLEAIRSCGIEFDGCFSIYEASICLVCEINDAMGYKGNTAESARLARDKLVARQVCEKAGIPSPRSAVASNLEEVEKACDHVGFPAVLKPSSGAGSVGVIRVESKEDAIKAYNDIKEDLIKSVFCTWNPGMEVQVIMEQYLVGDEFDVDVLMWDGEPVFTSVSDNWPTFEPYFLETGSSCPSNYPEEKQAELRAQVHAILKAMKFTQGCFHVEMKYTPEGPRLIEVNPRMGGGEVNNFNTQVWGVNLFENFLLSACGIPINPPRASYPLSFQSHYFVNAETTGTVANNTFLDHLKHHPNCQWVKYDAVLGQKVQGCDQGLPEWIGEIKVASGKSADDSAAIIKELVPTISNPIESAEVKRTRRESNAKRLSQVEFTVGA
eukprot:Nk52_evm1s266 gene=Nk52_evmTU1s266